MERMRIDRYLAECGAGSRSEVKQLLKKNLVTVNEVPVRAPEFKVCPDQDEVRLEGKLISYEPYEYVMLNKPSGCVTAVQDAHKKTVMEYLVPENCADAGEGFLRRRAGLAPAGRLDLDTEGLLLLTNDGGLTHRLLAPASHADKTYYAKVDGEVDGDDVRAFASGLEIGEKRPLLPARLVVRSSGAVSEVELTICEGKFHQVKRMFEARGKKVLYLKRISMGGVRLDPSLGSGQWRKLTKEETACLFASCGAGPRDGSQGRASTCLPE